MGDIAPIEDSFTQTTMPDDSGKEVSVVKVKFLMSNPVEDAIYEYLTTKTNEVKTKKEETLKEIKIEASVFPFKVLPTDKVIPFKNCIPLYDIKVAAGGFSDLQMSSEAEWIELNKPFKYSEDYFVCKVVGESMNKRIPNDSWCLFKKDSGGSRDGKIVLVHHNYIQDADFGNGFTVKLYESKKVVTEDGWKHLSIFLKPVSNNPDYKELILEEDELTDLKVEGIFVEVLK